MSTLHIQAETKRYNPRDLWPRLIGIPAIAFIMHLTLHKGEVPVIPYSSGWLGYLVSLCYTIAYWEGVRQIWMVLQRRLPHYSQTQKRLIIMAATVLVYGVVVTTVLENMSALLLGANCGLENIIKGYFKGLIPTTLVLMIYETVYFFYSWREKVIESEAMARSQIQTQLEALKNQLDPHFLFNSLNTLSSLINENEPAQDFLLRLSDVYRYLLTSRDRNTVTLKEEMAFVDDYLYLIKVRFQEGLAIEKKLDEDEMTKMVAPLSVQLLVENAIKHNVVSREFPLTISIQGDGNYLWVKNEIRPRVHLESSTKLGLRNILERYKLLTERPVQIVNNALQFEVALPFI